MSATTIIVVTAIVSTTVGLIGGALWNLLRSTIVKRVKVSSPESRQIKKISGAVKRHSFLIETMSDRMAAQSKSIIVLAQAVKSGTPEQADAALEVITIGERQNLTALTNRMIRPQNDIPDAESGEE